MAQVFAGKSGSNIRWQLAQILVDIYSHTGIQLYTYFVFYDRIYNFTYTFEVYFDPPLSVMPAATLQL